MELAAGSYGESELRLMMEGSEKISQGLIRTNDYVNNAILLNLYAWGRGGGWHACFDVENQFGFLANELDLNEHISGLKNIGLLSEGTARNTTMYKLTTLGALVAEKVEAHEMNNSYPAATQLIGRLKERYAPYPEIAGSLDSIMASVTQT